MKDITIELQKPKENNVYRKILNHSGPWIALVIPALFLLIFFCYPLFKILLVSFQTDEGFSASHYIRFFSEPLYLKVLLLTLKTGFIVTLFCVLLGYPVAYTMTFCSKKIKNIITIAVLLPFWTSLLVRAYAWMILLQSKGIVNNLLIQMGFIEKPIKLIYNSVGVNIGLTHVMLPYMILSLSSIMEAIDKNLLAASYNLGASKTETFLRIFLPLSVPGMVSGSILVFVMSIGYYITPALLGGPDNTMISQVIQTQIGDLLNWGFGAAISFVLLFITVILLVLSKKMIKSEKAY